MSGLNHRSLLPSWPDCIHFARHERRSRLQHGRQSRPMAELSHGIVPGVDGSDVCGARLGQAADEKLGPGRLDHLRVFREFLGDFDLQTD